MSFKIGELNRFFGSRLWKEIVGDLVKEMKEMQLKLLEETEPIKIGKLQGRVETLLEMANLHTGFMRENEASEIIDMLTKMVASNGELVDKFTPFEEMEQELGE